MGVAELQIGDGGPRVDEVVRLPEDLLAAAGAAVGRPRASPCCCTRQRADQHESTAPIPRWRWPGRSSLPTARTFSVAGTARVSGVAPDAAVDAALGAAGAVAAAVASAHLPGEPGMRGAAAIDGDPTTAWQTPLADVQGQTLTVIGGHGRAPSTTSTSP